VAVDTGVPQRGILAASERISQVKADQKARGRFLGGSVQFGYRLGEDGRLMPHEDEQKAIREMVALKAQGRSLRAIAAEMQAKGHKLSHVALQGALRACCAA
jgi:putative DNA-invertase from lambdoid prophage Rac